MLKFVKIVGVQEIAQYIRAINNKNNKIMKKWTQIEEINAGDVVLRSNGLIAPPSEIEVLSIRVQGTMAWMTWKWTKATDSYYSTSFRMSTNDIDYGFWHDLTSQLWELK